MAKKKAKKKTPKKKATKKKVAKKPAANKTEGKAKISMVDPALQGQALLDTNKLLMEALRHREQELLKYLAVLGPALGGFVWMVAKHGQEAGGIGNVAFSAGTVGVLVVLGIGIWYCSALGYNFRYLILQLGNIERELGIDKVLLKAWPHSPEDTQERTKLSHYLSFLDAEKHPKLAGAHFLLPPGLILVFWVGFVICLLFVMIAACVVLGTSLGVAPVVSVGGVCLIVGGWGGPWLHARKLRSMCRKELGQELNGNDQDALWVLLAVGVWSLVFVVLTIVIVR